ncbi:MAG: hypothetical protein L6R40_006959 [Gallowayella cf. fulva]|nr:MAG: hypothetical protein L6R40_006959 [Xanthomendoza cf. fulva]
MAQINDNNPLLKALPPAVDYLSYLTILEYNLTSDQLPVLHAILQDATLTANIGWDLVHLLLPLLPESQSCLQDVARLGNPREVVLKVTELLEALATTSEEEEEEEEEDEGEDDEAQGFIHQPQLNERQSEEPTSHPSHNNAGNPLSVHEYQTTPRQKPSKASQFSVLLDMLAVLYPRIRTKYPSRFLSTSLQAVLPAYAALTTDYEATESVLNFIKTFAGSKRPRLPPRKSSTRIPTQTATQQPVSAPDPEGTKEAIAPEEVALQQRLLHSFLTFVAEGYLSSLPIDDQVPASSWSSRLLEHLHPEKNIPGRRTTSEAFEKDEGLHRRDATIGQMLVRITLSRHAYGLLTACKALARDLDLPVRYLHRTIVEPESQVEEDSTDLPSSASDVPLSRPGCLYLLCASYASAILFHSRQNELEFPTPLAFFSLLGDFLGDPSSPILGSEPPSLIDSLLFLGHYILETSEGSFLGQAENESRWRNTLQYFSILSANTPSASLRYNAHLLTERILHVHPDDKLRLAFIKDTLEHCPYENLKASAVGWLKDEILEADSQPMGVHDGNNVFATSICIKTLAPRLFVDPMEMQDEEFLANENFWLASLNFLLFLRMNGRLGERLRVEEVVRGVSGRVEEVVGGDGGGGGGGGGREEEDRADGWLAMVERRLKEVRTDEEEEEGKGLVVMEGLIGMCRERER